MTLQGTLRFGPFSLSEETRQLLKGDAEVHLSPKAFELLLLLAANRPKALAKAELLERLWPDTFVSEANLPGLIKEIRRALDDDPHDPRFVRTLHRFGYAFAAPADVHASPVPRPEAVTLWLIADRPSRLVEGENILGRDPAATIWFDLPGVSRLHARITVSGESATLEDLGSKNGTWLRGDKVTAPAPLQDGDEVRLGPVPVTFRVRRTAASTEVVEQE